MKFSANCSCHEDDEEVCEACEEEMGLDPQEYLDEVGDQYAELEEREMSAAASFPEALALWKLAAAAEGLELEAWLDKEAALFSADGSEGDATVDAAIAEAKDILSGHHQDTMEDRLARLSASAEDTADLAALVLSTPGLDRAVLMASEGLPLSAIADDKSALLEIREGMKFFRENVGKLGAQGKAVYKAVFEVLSGGTVSAAKPMEMIRDGEDSYWPEVRGWDLRKSFVPAHKDMERWVAYQHDDYPMVFVEFGVDKLINPKNPGPGSYLAEGLGKKMTGTWKHEDEIPGILANIEKEAKKANDRLEKDVVGLSDSDWRVNYDMGEAYASWKGPSGEYSGADVSVTFEMVDEAVLGGEAQEAEVKFTKDEFTRGGKRYTKSFKSLADMKKILKEAGAKFRKQEGISASAASPLGKSVGRWAVIKCKDKSLAAARYDGQSVFIEFARGEGYNVRLLASGDRLSLPAYCLDIQVPANVKEAAKRLLRVPVGEAGSRIRKGYESYLKTLIKGQQTMATNSGSKAAAARLADPLKSGIR